MADRKFYSNIDLVGASEIKNGGFEKLAADPAAPSNGQTWINTTTDTLNYHVDGVTHVGATEAFVLAEINKLERAQGAFDASGSALPLPADKTTGDLTIIIAGDQWIVTTAGTIAGILGDDVLSIGDKLEFLGGDATVAANWVGINRNIDDTVSSGALKDRQTVTLVAATPLTITSVIVADIHSIQVYDSAGDSIEVCVSKTGNANERVIESNTALTNVVVELLG